jgi:dihydroorotase
LNDGTIDCLATDHAPHAGHEKETEFDVAPCGITGLDTALSVTWGLVRDGVLTRETFVRAWTTAPCTVFNLPVNTFAPGDPADFFLFDEDEEWTVTPQALHSKGKNTPLLGSVLKGRVKTHFIAGKKIV